MRETTVLRNVKIEYVEAFTDEKNAEIKQRVYFYDTKDLLDAKNKVILTSKIGTRSKSIVLLVAGKTYDLECLKFDVEGKIYYRIVTILKEA